MKANDLGDMQKKAAVVKASFLFLVLVGFVGTSTRYMARRTNGTFPHGTAEEFASELESQLHIREEEAIIASVCGGDLCIVCTQWYAVFSVLGDIRFVTTSIHSVSSSASPSLILFEKTSCPLKRSILSVIRLQL